ncbi:MAG: CotH kinase family protein, partial [Bacteroidota bacterium]|nr:CotH kinase family protein [Bacteroidota bacterium]
LINIFLIFTTLSFAQDLYDINKIRNIKLDFYNSNWDAILDTFQKYNSDKRVLADLTIDGIKYDSVGVRFKGNSSYRDKNNKNPFNIDINFVKDQNVYGYKKLKLSNMFKDPSGVREVLSYEILRNYMPAPKSNFVMLYINGKVHGLYTNVESISNDFLEKHFGSNDNPFFKCDPITITATPAPPPHGCKHVQGISSSLIDMGPDTFCYEQSYEIKSDYGWTDLMNLVLDLNGNISNIKNVLNVDMVLWMNAFNNVFINLDSYLGSGHNYYLYENDNKIFNTICWDLNMCFGSFTRIDSGRHLNIVQMISMPPDFAFYNANRPLVNKLMAVPEYRRRYYAHFKTIYTEFLQNDKMQDRAVVLHSMIDSFVTIDSNYFYSYYDFLRNINQNVGYGPQTTVGVNLLMDNRSGFLSFHSQLKKTQAEITDISQSVEFPMENEDVWISAKISNSTQAFLYYRSDLFVPFNKIQMFDDGNHHDGNASDGIYGVQIPGFNMATNVNYYIYAENLITNTAKLSPERAEFEYYSYIVGNQSSTSDIVINELMASNNITVADQNNEYDDWVEIYNNSSNNISLKGMGLTDDENDIFQFVFPDTFIAAHGFIIVWIDDDEEQQGLHTNFKLSKAGEKLILSDSQAKLIDQVIFNNQTTDISFGRYPNATGNFEFMPPTFNASNISYSDVYEAFKDNNVSIKVYPNPTNGFLTIEAEKLFVEIFDVNGKIIFKSDKVLSSICKVDLQGKKDGLYFVRFYNNDFVKVKKIILRK